MDKGRELTDEPLYKVGQVVILKGKKEAPFRILDRMQEHGCWYYAWNRRNFAAESMVRPLTVEEAGFPLQSAPKPGG